MGTIRLRRDAGVGLFVADLGVLYFALTTALDEEAPMTFRLGFFAVTALALALGAHSVFSIFRRTGRRYG